VWLTLTGYVFYGYWGIPRFTLLMAFSTAVSFSAGLGFLLWSDPRKRRLCLVVPIAVDLSLLGFFKYANFALTSTEGVLGLFGVHPGFPHLNIILPIGISFYTFHTISYIVDAYRGDRRRATFSGSPRASLFSRLIASRPLPWVRDPGRIAESSPGRWSPASRLCHRARREGVIADTFAARRSRSPITRRCRQASGVLVSARCSLLLTAGYSDMAVVPDTCSG
jgi:hypothetical protein